MTLPVVMVTNDVSGGIVPENAMARTFRSAQGRLNQRLAAQADLVVFVTAGLPQILKGDASGDSGAEDHVPDERGCAGALGASGFGSPALVGPAWPDPRNGVHRLARRARRSVRQGGARPAGRVSASQTPSVVVRPVAGLRHGGRIAGTDAPPDMRQLREFDFGAWDGLDFDAVAARDPELSRAFWDTPGDVAAPDGESFFDVGGAWPTPSRGSPGRHPGTDLIAVAHMGVIMGISAFRPVWPEGGSPTRSTRSQSRASTGRRRDGPSVRVNHLPDRRHQRWRLTGAPDRAQWPMTYQLLIGQRGHSSWSLRGWLPFAVFDIDVSVQTTRIYSDEFKLSSRSLRRCGHGARRGHPEGGLLTDSIAIAWHLAEAFPDRGLLPGRPEKPRRGDQPHRRDAFGLHRPARGLPDEPLYRLGEFRDAA
jgi:broad specificity phosphatase PhoE